MLPLDSYRGHFCLMRTSSILICLDNTLTGLPPSPVTTIAPKSAIYGPLRNVAILPPTRSWMEKYDNNQQHMITIFIMSNTIKIQENIKHKPQSQKLPCNLYISSSVDNIFCMSSPKYSNCKYHILFMFLHMNQHSNLVIDVTIHSTDSVGK